MDKSLKDILVPVDFNEPSYKAVKHACRLAQEFEGTVHMLHILETSGMIADFLASGDYLVHIINKSRDKLGEIAALAGREFPSVTIKRRVDRGKPYQKILEAAEQINARFIILGENHEGEDMEQHLGSTVYHVTLKSPAPVVTLKGDSGINFENILVPLDLTRKNSNQLISAATYGRNYGAEIHLVSALIGGIAMKQSLIYARLKDAKATLEENGLDCSIKLFERSEKPPYQTVLEYADQINAGMILLMTHQEGYTYDNYIGAFAHHIINQSRVSVLSLTSSATLETSKNLLKDIVDPVGILSKS